MSYTVTLRARIPLEGGDYSKGFVKIEASSVTFTNTNRVLLTDVSMDEEPEWIQGAERINSVGNCLSIDRTEEIKENLDVYVTLDGKYVRVWNEESSSEEMEE